MKRTVIIPTILFLSIVCISFQFLIPLNTISDLYDEIIEDPLYDSILIKNNSVTFNQSYEFSFRIKTRIGDIVDLNNCLLPGGEIAFKIEPIPSFEKSIKARYANLYKDYYIHYDNAQLEILGYFNEMADIDYVDDYINGIYAEYNITLPDTSYPKGTIFSLKIPYGYEVRRSAGTGSEHSFGSYTHINYYDVLEPIRYNDLIFSIPISDYSSVFLNQYKPIIEKTKKSATRHIWYRLILFAFPILFIAIIELFAIPIPNDKSRWILVFPLIIGILGSISLIILWILLSSYIVAIPTIIMVILTYFYFSAYYDE